MEQNISIENDRALTEFHPFDIHSGRAEHPLHDPTCFWFPETARCKAMLQHLGFKDVQRGSAERREGGLVRSMIRHVRLRNKRRAQFSVLDQLCSGAADPQLKQRLLGLNRTAEVV